MSHTKKAPNLIMNIRWAGSLLWESHPIYTIIFACLTFIQGGLPIAQLWISKLLIDSVAAIYQGGVSGVQVDPRHLFFWVVLQAGLYLLSNLISTSQETVRSFLGELLSNRVNLRILEKNNGLEVAFFENEKFYNKLQNAQQEAGYRPLEIINQIFAFFQTLITLFSVILLLLRLHWGILPLIFVSTLPILLVQTRYSSRNYWMLRERAPEIRKQGYYSSLLTSNWFIKEIRIFHLEEYFLNLYRSLFSKFFSENKGLVIKRSKSITFASAISILGWLLAACYVVQRVVTRSITIGDFALYIQAILIAQGQFQALLGGLGGLYSNSLFLQNLFEFLSIDSRDLSEGKQWNEPIREIEFCKVSFSYPGTDRTVLNNISFKVSRGQSLALVGRNGAGKTTLAKLLCRLYEPSSGEILVNGQNIIEYSPQSFQKRISILFQDYGHYYLSAKDNIGIGRPATIDDMSNIESSAKRSGADELIRSLPEGYETMLGKWFDDGVELSGGEWQKVALARGFHRGGDVLVLDEPTAALDAEAEYEVFEDLTKNSVNQITLLISHRFSTVRMANHVLVLDDGNCIEAGSHDELLALGGQYANLFKLQARGYEYHLPSVNNK